MNCRELSSLLATHRRSSALPPEALAHLAACPHCAGLANLSWGDHAAHAATTPALEQAVLARMDAAGLAPVRPMAAPAVYRTVFAAIILLAAVTAAAALGFRGWRAHDAVQLAVLGIGLVAVGAWAVTQLERHMVPASRLLLPPRVLPLVALALAALATALYPAAMYPRFWLMAIGCLAKGLILGAITGWLVAALVRRRGYVTDPSATGLTIGVCAGLAALTAQILYCFLVDDGHFFIAHFGAVCGALVIGKEFWARKLR
jgi:hypothetical protein